MEGNFRIVTTSYERTEGGIDRVECNSLHNTFADAKAFADYMKGKKECNPQSIEVDLFGSMKKNSDKEKVGWVTRYREYIHKNDFEKLEKEYEKQKEK